MSNGRTVMQVLESTVEKHGDSPALRVKEGGAWRATSYRRYRDDVRRAARGMMKLGLEPGLGVAIIGFNCPEWVVADVAAIYAGGVPAGIYTTSTPEQCQYIASHCDAAIAVVEDAEQLAKFVAVRAELPRLRAIVVMHGAASGEGVHTWSELLALGDAVPEADLEARMAAQRPDDVCTLIYTSGTTGQPKAVMITHDNVTWTAEQAISLLGVAAGEQAISYLPLSHVAEQMLSIHGPMRLGVCVWFAESLEKLGDNLREVRPHYFMGVPRVWEKIQEKMQAAGAANSGLKKKLAAWARGVGLEGQRALEAGRPRPLLYGVADKLVFSKVRERLGLDRCRLQVTSAAPISRDTLEFFGSLGIPLYEVYGMSECTGPATISLPGRIRTGKAGFAMPGTELKIAADGEVCMRGRHVFKGYLKNPEATGDTLDAEGWLHSGDVGTIDAEGFLQITDRKKDLLITAGGENIAPQLIEGMLKGIPVVSQAVVVGDRAKYLAALLTLDAAKVVQVAAACGSPAKTAAEAATCPTFTAALQLDIDGVNGKLARVQTVKRWTVLAGELTIEGGELTPTMKVKRKVVNEKYASEIAALYREP